MPRITRRRSLAWAFAATATAACGPLFPPSASQPPEEDLDALAARLVYGGAQQDQIRPIDLPDFDPADAVPLPATTLTPGSAAPEDDDVVDAFIGPDRRARAYPRLVTVWHEVVNDVVADIPITLSFCPLTGSTVVFSGVLPDGSGTSFGTSGELLDSNLVMWDRASRSKWPQLLGTAVAGDRKGTRLQEIPGVVTTTYGRWRARFPQTGYLTTLTGSLRAYGTSPYGDYDRSDRIIFPVARSDGRMHPKALVYGVRERGAALAITKERALRERITAFDLGGEPLVAIADPDLAAIRVFRRRLGSQTVELRAEGGGIVDAETSSRWSYAGVATEGELARQRLEPVNTFEVFWFAWYAFHPRTAVIA